MEKAEHVVTRGIRNSYRKGVTDMKVDRHSKIVELIGKYQIETQEELASYLKEAGYHVTQATVSRDIRELKLTKVQKENGRQCYSVMQHQRDFGRSISASCGTASYPWIWPRISWSLKLCPAWPWRWQRLWM